MPIACMQHRSDIASITRAATSLTLPAYRLALTHHTQWQQQLGSSNSKDVSGTFQCSSISSGSVSRR